MQLIITFFSWLILPILGTHHIVIFVMNNLNTIGLVLNFIGTLLVAVYIQKDPKEYVENENNSKEKWYSLYIKYPKLFDFGLLFIILGFLLSFIDSFYN